MTPAARVSAAIEILDLIIAGQAAEQALTRWARGSRFAGSGDRAAVRDHVFDALRNWRSDAVRGGGTDGRARMLGRLRAQVADIDAVFSGDGHAPAPLTSDEQDSGKLPSDKGDLWDLPDWLITAFETSLGDQAEVTALALKERAPVTLRVNTARTDVTTAQTHLLAGGIETVANPRAATALTVTKGPRRLRNSSAYLDGLVELQDAASQAAILGLEGRGRALDFCAGGGGKSLALAAQGWAVTAHDINAKRMVDLPARAARGGHDIAICPPEALATAGEFDLVFCDAPCSGAGTWRRTPEAKWALTPERLDELLEMQAQVLDQAAAHVSPAGRLVYATCSVLAAENTAQIEAFLSRTSGWQLAATQSWGVDAWGDGFFVAQLERT